jgi:hypothetical protein
MVNSSSLLGTARENTRRGELAVHDHVCGIYDTLEEQYEPACRFIAVGLERQQQCLYVAEHLTPDEFASRLTAHGVDVKQETSRGALQITSGRALRSKLGGFTPQAMFSFLTQSEKAAKEGGFTAFRWAADMQWLRKDGIELSNMFLFEAELNHLLSKLDLVCLCQYAICDFSPELLIAAAETHPLLVYNDLVCDNFYFVPPEEYLKSGFAETKLKRILFNIVSRERLMQNLLSD